MNPEVYTSRVADKLARVSETLKTQVNEGYRYVIAVGLIAVTAAGSGTSVANAQNPENTSPLPAPPAETHSAPAAETTPPPAVEVPPSQTPTPPATLPLLPEKPAPSSTKTPLKPKPSPALSFCQGKAATIIGTAKANKIIGTAQADVIVGRGGNDIIKGGGGKDIICGGEGNDRINGGGGNDKISGGTGNDLLEGGAGTQDRIDGGKGGDELVGEYNNGGTGKDWCRGGKVYTACETNRGRTVVPGVSTRVGSGKLFTYTVEIEKGVAEEGEAVADEVDRILADPKGWIRGGKVSFQRVTKNPSTRIILATPDTVDKICAKDGMDTEGKVSCQQGQDEIINLTRWRQAVPHWTSTLANYRNMVINHETGHRIGFGHSFCASKGSPAPVMQQQTYFLKGCKANWLPLEGEINRLG